MALAHRRLIPLSTVQAAGAVYVRGSKAVGGGPVLRVGRDERAVFVALAAG